ncbi:sigma-B regulation protein RsbU (phosphoserine phosphatase) [Halalkalibacter nanhaiisediminis]|uniref:Sigma-B regulation protein RsbU (Phosphoserine phosphatase) n=2 Tax=Halalkalibacter nanhaiisediminis TaxID=688079 RepID=A0A562QME7_9BACI|nr:sigma-B regulation protein RsbU (phosphoserine phosphatase) [Halalkalibacter nanhaiisediminis]
MAITQISGSGCFIGIPIMDKNENVYGTLCAMDSDPYQFTDEHIRILKSLTSILSYVVELENAEKKMSTELAKAKAIQKSVLSPKMDDEHIQIEGVYYPTHYLSGDMYSWYKIDSSRYGIMLIDVMGHGVSASLISMALRSLMTNLILKVIDPVDVCKELNKQLYKLLPSKIISYATGIYLVIDTKLKTIEYVNTGHPPGLLKLDGDLVDIEPTSTAIGLIEAPEISKKTFSYQKDIDILLYTDGLLELDGEKSLQKNVTKLSSLFINQNISIFDWIETQIIEKSTEFPDDISIVRVKTK